MTRKLLVVDDNVQVLRLVKRMLSKADFEVDTAAGSEDAIAWCRQFGPPDLLISDVRMPVMSGPRLYERLKETHGNFPVLFISGYTGGEWDGACDILEKPFSKEDLLNAVNGHFPRES